MAIDALGGGDDHQPSDRPDELKAAMLAAAGWSPDTDLSQESQVEELIKAVDALGPDRLKTLMREKGGMSEKLINRELDVLRKELEEVKLKVSGGGAWYCMYTSQRILTSYCAPVNTYISISEARCTCGTREGGGGDPEGGCI